MFDCKCYVVNVYVVFSGQLARGVLGVQCFTLLYRIFKNLIFEKLVPHVYVYMLILIFYFSD